MRLSILTVILTLVCFSVFAADNQPPEPPKEAFTACSGLSVGATCSMTGMKGETMSGVCRQTPSGTACAPNGGQPPKRSDDSGRSNTTN